MSRSSSSSSSSSSFPSSKFTAEEVEQGSLNPDDGLVFMDQSGEEKENVFPPSTLPAAATSHVQKSAFTPVKQQPIVLKKDPSAKKTTKPPPSAPQVQVKAANIALPKTAPNGAKIKFLAPKGDYQQEEVHKLVEIPEGDSIFIQRWRDVNGKFGPTHILYTYPDEDMVETPYWSNYRADLLINNVGKEKDKYGLAIFKRNAQLFYGVFEK